MDWTLHSMPFTESSRDWLKEFSGTMPPPADALHSGQIYADKFHVIRNSIIYILPSGPEFIEKLHCRKIKEQRDKVDEFLQSHRAELDGIDEEDKEQILAATAEALHQHICARKWTARLVALVYCAKCLDSHAKTNCLTELLFKEAIQRAEDLDRILSSTGQPVGRFHGVPFSIKDTFDIEGQDSSIGLLKNCFDARSHTADLVKFIQQQGGVILAKTNVPQTLMSFECSNPVWGPTSNPHCSEYSPGGSSGGEAALIGSGGSVLGIGSDIGGSLRIPAHFSGICSLKPSYGRLSHLGSTSCKPMNLFIEPVSGPMALHASDLLYFCKVAFGHPASDVVPLLFRDNLIQGPIKYGFCTSGPFMESSPVCQRAVKTAVLALKASGADVVEYQFPESFRELTVSFYSLMSADGWKFYLDKLGADPREPCIRNLLKYASFSDWFKRVCASASALFVKDPRALAIISAIRSKDAYSVIKLQSELSRYEQEFHKSITSAGIDILITPTHVLPANPIGSFGNIHFTAAYTFAWNLLNVPIGCLPVVRFDSGLDEVEGEWPRKFEFSDIFAPDLLERAAKNYYNPNHIQGLPAGIQLVGLPNDDERVLFALAQLESLLGGC